MSPSFIVGIIAILLSGIIFVYNRHNQIKMGFKEKQKAMKVKQKELQALAKEDAKGNKDKIDKLQKEVMKESMQLMKGNFKNMIWIMVFSLLIFIYIGTFTNAAFPVGKFIGINAVFVWYIIVSLAANLLYKLIFTLLEKKNIIKSTY